MPIEPGDYLRKVSLRGILHVSCDGFRFSLRCEGDRVIVDFPSFPMLLRGRKIARDLNELTKQLPPLPSKDRSQNAPSDSFTLNTEILIAVKSHPVAKLDLRATPPKLTPTPLRFFSKR